MSETFVANESLEQLSFEKFREEVLNDFEIACISRQLSLIGRREVLTGKAKFGIFGDGKEIPQIALSKFFKPGDWRSGYYRDQTWMIALGICTPQQFFAQLYADPNIENDPWSAGRQMNAHFSSKNVNEHGEWMPLADQYNVAADMAPTAAQLPRALGLAAASKHFREIEQLKGLTSLSNNGQEICFCTIGDASTSEGHFWETINAAAVMQVPLAVFIWDDGYGISVPKALQTAKGSVSKILAGFEKGESDLNGIKIYKAKAWDYAGLCEVFEAGIEEMRINHVPAVFHIEEVTQPQGHSTSGSHERYKTEERLQWERDWDCIAKFRQWLTANELASEEELSAIEVKARTYVRKGRDNAWKNYISPIKEKATASLELLKALAVAPDNAEIVNKTIEDLSHNKEPLRRDALSAVSIGLQFGIKTHPSYKRLLDFEASEKLENKLLFNSHAVNEGPMRSLNIKPIAAIFNEDSPIINGFEILNKYFDELFTNNPKVIAFGEDLGMIGDVNQGFAGLQQKHGKARIFDTGIREATIMGQGIGLALRGLRPIAEIQYIDYLLYALQQLSDEVSTLNYRTVGQLKCPIIVRTRGHRLEGIWHSGSPMSLMLSALRGMHICVPRDMTTAAGMYNTILQSNDPAIVVECLNGYRLKERLPNNLASFCVPLGKPEVLKSGDDLTIVSYGSTLRLVSEAAERLTILGHNVEVIDVQTLLPFDVDSDIVKSLQKTSRLLIVDEDVPGGASAFIFNKILEEQGGYKWLDATPRTLSAKAHRPAYGSDGDYFSKPNTEDIVSMALNILAE